MSDLDRPAPPAGPRRRDWSVSTVVAASVLVHASVVAIAVWSHRAEAARPPAEIPIEVVQLPPEPKPPEPKPAASKPPAPKVEAAKPAEQKPPAPKPPEQKPPEPKPPAAKQAAKPPAPKPTKSSEPKQAQKTPQPQPEPQTSVAERMARLIGAPSLPTALPSMAADGGGALDDSMPYKQLVLSLVAKQVREDKHDGIPGHVVVAFTIGDRGEVLTDEVVEKSLDPQLDAEAVSMVRRGAPYPPPPPGAMRQFAFGLRFGPR